MIRDARRIDDSDENGASGIRVAGILDGKTRVTDEP